MRSIIISGPTTTGKSFFLQDFNKIYKGEDYTMGDSGVNWFLADAYAYNSWRIDEIKEN